MNSISTIPIPRSIGRVAAIVLLVASGQLVARAIQPPLIPRALLFGNPEYLSPLISPDGTRIAYLKADSNRVMQIWVRDLSGKYQRQLTHEVSRGIKDNAFSWAYNGQLLFFKDKDGDELERLFACDPVSGKVRDLTPSGSKAMLIGCVRAKPDEVLITLNRQGQATFDIWSVNLSTGALSVVLQNPGDVTEWVVNNALKVGAGITKDENGNGKLSLLVNQTNWQTVLSWNAADLVDVIGFSQDDKKLFFRSNVGTDKTSIYSLTVATGKQARVFSDPQSELQAVEVDPKTQVPQAVICYRMKPRWQILDRSIRRDFGGLARVSRGDFAVISRDLADTRWTVVFQSDTNANHFYLWDRVTQKAEPLFWCWPELEHYPLSSTRALEVKARDGLLLPVYLTLPAGLAPNHLPMVLLVHGGPRLRDYWGYQDGMVQWLANRGYAVLQVNYRGSYGFGKAFLHAGDGQFAGKMNEDLIDAVNWTIRHGVADPKRIAIMGGSYGGYAALVGLTFTPGVFAAGVDICGFSDLRTFVESAPAYWRPFLPSGWYQMVGRPDVPADRLDMERRSPLFRIDQIQAPLLVGQGANDPRVQKKESDQLVAALRSRGKEVEYIFFPDEGHGFARPQNNRRFNAAVEQFLAKHLGGRCEPPSADERVDGFLQ